MITREKKPVFPQQHLVSSCMTGSEDDSPRTDPGIVSAVQNNFGVFCRSSVQPVNDSLRVEMACIVACIRHVILMSQENMVNSTHTFKRFYQMLRESWRIDQPISIRVFDEITVRTKRIACIVSVDVNAGDQFQAKRLLGLPQISFVMGADGGLSGRRAKHVGHPVFPYVFWAAGAQINTRRFLRRLTD